MNQVKAEFLVYRHRFRDHVHVVALAELLHEIHVQKRRHGRAVDGLPGNRSQYSFASIHGWWTK